VGEVNFFAPALTRRSGSGHEETAALVVVVREKETTA
jgi:hypothetical protein